jgi:hypothetical protein
MRCHDLVVMAAIRNQGQARIFFGSLFNSVVRNCRKPCRALLLSHVVHFEIEATLGPVKK